MSPTFIPEVQPRLFPFLEQAFYFKSCAINLFLPHPAAIKTFYLNQKENGLEAITPYWSRLWPAALGLCYFLEDHLMLLRNKRVLELGAGLGLPSLFAAGYAEEIYCTDIDPNAIVWAKHAATANGLSNISHMVADWNRLPNHLMNINLLLLSDANYNPEAFGGLLETVQTFLENGVQVIVSTPQRLSGKTFVAELLPYCKKQEQFSIDMEGTNTMTSVFLLEK